MRRSIISTLLGVACVALVGCGPNPIASAPPANAASPLVATEAARPAAPSVSPIPPGANVTEAVSPKLTQAIAVAAGGSASDDKPGAESDIQRVAAVEPEPTDDAAPPAKSPDARPAPTQPGTTPPSETKPAPAKAGAKPPAVKRYAFRRQHDPNGIGKFYMEREIAHVMGFVAAGWLERSEREEEERLTVLIEELKLAPGMAVADIGAGSGRISLMMAEKVGPEGKILAVDVQQKMLDLLAKKIKQAKIDNVELILGTPRSPKIKPGVLDMALMVDVYHEFEWPYEMLLEISRSLKPGGRLVFVEYRMEDPKVNIKLVHKMTEAQVKKEASVPEFKLKWKETIESLPQQHMIIFERLADDEEKKLIEP